MQDISLLVRFEWLKRA